MNESKKRSNRAAWIDAVGLALFFAGILGMCVFLWIAAGPTGFAAGMCALAAVVGHRIAGREVSSEKESFVYIDPDDPDALLPRD